MLVQAWTIINRLQPWRMGLMTYKGSSSESRKSKRNVNERHARLQPLTISPEVKSHPRLQACRLHQYLTQMANLLPSPHYYHRLLSKNQSLPTIFSLPHRIDSRTLIRNSMNPRHLNPSLTVDIQTSVPASNQQLPRLTPPPLQTDQNRPRPESRAADPTSLSLEIRATNTPLSSASQPTSQSTNGRSTPTMSGFSSQIDSVRGTNSTSQSPLYSGDGSGSPGSGTAQASYAQGKGSRFAKFWDNKPKDPVSNSSPQQPQQQSSITSLPPTSSAPQGWPAPSQTPNDLRASSRSLNPQPRQISGGSDQGVLSGLFKNLNVGGASFERQERPVPPVNGNMMEGDRMQNLLSMLSPQQVRHLESSDPA